MPKRRSTIPIAHADDLPTIAFTDEEWQAVEQAYARQLDAEVRQQITTVTTQYLKDCVFERAAVPKEMARERIERIRRAAGDLESVMLNREAFSASSDELSRQQRQSAHSYADRLIADRLILTLEPDERGRTDWLMGYVAEVIRQQLDKHEAPNGKTRRRVAGPVPSDELSKQQSDEHSYEDGLIRRHLDEQSLARHKLHHLRDALKSLVVACEQALNDLSATENSDDEPWNWWIQALTQIVQRHDLPYGARIVETSGEPSPFVALVRALQLARALQEHVPARHTFSDEALAKAIQRAQSRARDK
jgi:hypothetical protein